MFTQLVQIVPRLPPAMDGVGEYGLTLAHELRTAHGIETRFFCGKPGWEGPAEVDGFRVRSAGQRSGEALDRFLSEEVSEDAVVLLNYVPTGYDRNSCPFWLLGALKRWDEAEGRGRLVTMYHEIYGGGPPWTRAFWTFLRQRHIAARIARQSVAVRTNVAVVHDRLEKLAPRHRGRIACVPVISNVGESAGSPAPAERKPWVAVFGTAGWRSKAYQDYRKPLEAFCARLGVELVVDIGPPLDFSPQLNVPVKSCGRLPADEVAQTLRQSRFGFVTYPSAWLGKSGIFAAYCAHGCVPVAPAVCRQQRPRSMPGIPVIFDDEIGPGTALAGIQRRVTDWYGQHSLAAQGREYAALFGQIEGTCA